MRNTDVKLKLQFILFGYKDVITEELKQELEELHDEIESDTDE